MRITVIMQSNRLSLIAINSGGIYFNIAGREKRRGSRGYRNRWNRVREGVGYRNRWNRVREVISK